MLELEWTCDACKEVNFYEKTSESMAEYGVGWCEDILYVHVNIQHKCFVRIYDNQFECGVMNLCRMPMWDVKNAKVYR